LDLAKPETELDSGLLEQNRKDKSNGEVADQVRESRSWTKSLADLSFSYIYWGKERGFS
jgi:hypothetical protein